LLTTGAAVLGQLELELSTLSDLYLLQGCRQLPMSPKAEKKFLKKVNKVIGGVLSEEERKVLLEAINALKIKEVSELIDYVLHQ
jgi:hypothetical protein